MKRASFFISTFFAFNMAFANLGNHPSMTRFYTASDVGPKILQSSANDVWSDVKVDLKWVSGAINIQACAASQRNYLACVLAVQVLASVLDKNVEVMPIKQLNGKTPLAQVSRLALVEAPLPAIKSIKDAVTYFEQMRTQLSGRFFIESLQFISSPNSDFELLMAQIAQKATKPIPQEVLVATVGKFFEIAMDPHTSFQPTKQMEKSLTESGSSFVGIGVEIMRLEQGLLVRKTMKDSGAAKAGIQTGDIITHVDGIDISKMKEDEALPKLRGNAGTQVVLKVQRQSQELEVRVTRSAVISAVVSSEDPTFNGKRIKYIRLANFMYEKACDEIEQIIVQAEKQNVDGYVLDLRGNPGGKVTLAACLTGFFIGDKKTVVYFEQIKGSQTSEITNLDSNVKTVTRRPLSVLINSGSASASEIVSGALRDYSRALIVGQTSFGKGSHQGCGQLSAQPEITMCATQGLFFAPSGESNQTVGVVPHVSVYLNKVPQDVETYAMRESQLFLFPLPKKNMNPAPAGNWNQMKVPTNCMNNLKLESLYDQAANTEFYFHDFQMLNALAAVDCAGKN